MDTIGPFFHLYEAINHEVYASGAYKHHKVVQRSIRHAWISGSNCCRMPLCAFYHLRIVLTAEAIVALQKQMAKYTRKP